MADDSPDARAKARRAVLDEEAEKRELLAGVNGSHAAPSKQYVEASLGKPRGLDEIQQEIERRSKLLERNQQPAPDQVEFASPEIPQTHSAFERARRVLATKMRARTTPEHEH